MNRVFAYAGWVAAVTATVCAVWFALDVQRKAADLRRIGGEVTALREDLGRAHAATDDLKARCEALAARTARTEGSNTPDTTASSPSLLESAMGMLKDPSPTGADKKADVADLVKGLIKAGAKESPGGLAAMFEGSQGEQMIDVSSKITTNLQYDPFVNGLEIPDEQKQRVRDILTKHNSDIMRKSLGAMQGGGDLPSASEDAKKLKAQLRDELGTVLGADDLDQFDTYQEELPERMLSQNMDMQLGMFAGGLTPENKTLVRDVLVQELLPGQRDPTVPPTSEQLSNLSFSHGAAFDRALQRLQPSLAPDQYVEVEGFVRQQRELMDMVSSMMPKPAEPAAGTTVTPAQ